MRHDWIFDVLRDLQAYAQMHGLPRLAEQSEEALRVALDEIRAAASCDGQTEPDSGSSSASFGQPF